MSGPRYDLAHARGNRGAARICILDTGLSAAMPAHALWDFSGSGIRVDANHGTLMTRVVYDVCPDAWVWFGKVTGGNDVWGAIADGIRWAVASKVDAVSISLVAYLGFGQGADPRVGKAVADALAAGVGIFASAGNDRSRTDLPTPAAFTGVCRCAWDQHIPPGSTAVWPVGNGMSSVATAAIAAAYGLYLATDNNTARRRCRYLLADAGLNPFSHWRDVDLPWLRNSAGVPYCGNL